MRINRIILEKGAESFQQTLKIENRLKNIPVLKANPEDLSYSKDLDKESIRLLPFKGELFKPCPGTRNYICCGYQILNGGTNCPLNCSYCILQSYFNKPSLRIF